MAQFSSFANKKIHFIGIGGISMSALAIILSKNHCIVSGSDRSDSAMLRRLRESGIRVIVGHGEDNIDPDTNLVVYTAAIKDDNPELMRARSLGIETVERAVLLGRIMQEYSLPVAVAGTHGKTTSTGMLAEILIDAGLDPTVTIGGELASIGGNLRIGEGDCFVAEACEYHRSFLQFSPKYSIILNIEEDHLDYYKDISEIRAAFRALAEITPDDGAVIANGDDANVRHALSGTDRNVIYFGIDDSDCEFTATNIVTNELGHNSFTACRGGEPLARVLLSVPGRHNVYNALAVFACAVTLGVSPESAVRGISKFTGVDRRFQKKGEWHGIPVIDDYAHHPTEIASTLKTAREMTKGNLWCVFQPHTYTRTKALFDDFVTAFNNSGAKVIMLDIYAAREIDDGSISARDLSDAINDSVYVSTADRAAAHLRRHAQEGDMIITMGAGDVYITGEILLKDEE